MTSLPFQLPLRLEHELTGREWSAVSVGKSKAQVFRLEGGLYLKVLSRDDRDLCFGNLEGERARLEWLAGKLQVPSVVGFERDETSDFLVMTEMPGRDAVAMAPLVAALPGVIDELAAACRLIHALPSHGCPFADDASALIAQAGDRLAAGLVDTDDFDAERRGTGPRELLAELQALRPTHEDLVITHGDLCLPNIMFSGERCTGFVDVGRAGVADRFRDLALCARSIRSNSGSVWSDLFLERYGAARDEPKRSFYVLLDEFF